MAKLPMKTCEKCQRVFRPKFPSAKLCVFCWAAEQPRIYGTRQCETCGKDFEPAMEWYYDCPECYQAKQTESGAEVTTWQDIPPDQHDESEYRRGYAGGWIKAAGAMLELIRNDKAQAAYDRCFKHWETDLLDWMKGDCSQFVEPPEMRGNGEEEAQ